MAKKEIRIIYRILAVLGTVIVIAVIAGYVFLRFNSPYLFRFSEDVAEKRVMLRQDEITGFFLHSGISGCENLLLDQNSLRFWVTGLDGNLTELNGPDRKSISISRQVKPGNMLTGISMGPDSLLLVAVSDFGADGWMHEGGRIVAIDTMMGTMETVTGRYPALNGIASDGGDLLYFTSSNFNPFNPAGYIYRTELKGGVWTGAQPVSPNVGMANGIFFDTDERSIIFSNTVEGVFRLNPDSNEIETIYYKAGFLEITDDLCKDSRGNLWMTDPGNSTLKVLLADESSLVRFAIKGVGQTSSCRIRHENGMEVIYFTELKKKHNIRSDVYNGRGVYSLPLEELLQKIPRIN